MKTKLLALAIFAGLIAPAAAGTTSNSPQEVQDVFGKYTWRKAHDMAMKASRIQCENLKGTVTALGKPERDKWSAWITENAHPEWTRIRNNPDVDWAYGGLRCKRGKEEYVRLVWAFSGPFGMSGVLYFMNVGEQKPTLVITQPTNPQWREDFAAELEKGQK